MQPLGGAGTRVSGGYRDVMPTGVTAIAGDAFRPKMGVPPLPPGPVLIGPQVPSAGVNVAVVTIALSSATCSGLVVDS